MAVKAEAHDDLIMKKNKGLPNGTCLLRELTTIVLYNCGISFVQTILIRRGL